GTARCARWRGGDATNVVAGRRVRRILSGPVNQTPPRHRCQSVFPGYAGRITMSDDNDDTRVAMGVMMSAPWRRRVSPGRLRRCLRRFVRLPATGGVALQVAR